MGNTKWTPQMQEYLLANIQLPIKAIASNLGVCYDTVKKNMDGVKKRQRKVKFERPKAEYSNRQNDDLIEHYLSLDI